ncbi:hypothetical protein ACFFX1_24135 [Dactylosporangium sucinum]|uniref:Uncharacterized protein n=1 Tax=Dactylosporangium sucinum TaxID=1424081 RepID=A0A917TZL0_9ACTN|nr:hypothetical protein [Dactylosporangium sucinum]GGM43890.1 hypothetical protein GCM10007977_051850 [Dactylosporangium sucinum]
MNRTARRVLLAVAFVVATTAVGVATNYATGARLDDWDKAASWVSAGVAAASLLVSAFAAFFTQRAFNTEERARVAREQLAFTLIRSFAAIEQEALNYGKRSAGRPDRPLSLREVRALMADSEVWNDQDEIGFDLATRARNSIVHGDLEKVDILDLRYANEKAQHLLGKIRSATHTST